MLRHKWVFYVTPFTVQGTSQKREWKGLREVKGGEECSMVLSSEYKVVLMIMNTCDYLGRPEQKRKGENERGKDRDQERKKIKAQI